MIDIEKAKRSFNKFLERYRDQDVLGFQLKIVHIYHVVESSKDIATKLGLSDEDIALAELVALLHDIGRLAEIDQTGSFDSSGFDHAAYGVKLLFEDDLIRTFVADSRYDEIIKSPLGTIAELPFKMD